MSANCQHTVLCCHLPDLSHFGLKIGILVIPALGNAHTNSAFSIQVKSLYQTDKQTKKGGKTDRQTWTIGQARPIK